MTVNRLYYQDLAKLTELSNEQINEQIGKLQQGDDTALHKIVEGNLKLVVHYAKQFKKAAKQAGIIEFDDIVSEGNIGLIRACHSFDPSKQIRFQYYASFWIKHQIKKYILMNENIIRSPENKLKTDVKIHKEVMKLFQKLEMDITELDVQALEMFTNDEIDHYFNVNGVTELPESYDFVDHVNDEQEVRDEQIEMIRSTFQYLTPKQRHVVKAYFGLDCERQNLTAIAKKMDVTKAWVGQILKNALTEIKKRLAG